MKVLCDLKPPPSLPQLMGGHERGMAENIGHVLSVHMAAASSLRHMTSNLWWHTYGSDTPSHRESQNNRIMPVVVFFFFFF